MVEFVHLRDTINIHLMYQIRIQSIRLRIQSVIVNAKGRFGFQKGALMDGSATATCH